MTDLRRLLSFLSRFVITFVLTGNMSANLSIRDITNLDNRFLAIRFFQFTTVCLVVAYVLIYFPRDLLILLLGVPLLAVVVKLIPLGILFLVVRIIESSDDTIK